MEFHAAAWWWGYRFMGRPFASAPTGSRPLLLEGPKLNAEGWAAPRRVR